MELSAYESSADSALPPCGACLLRCKLHKYSSFNAVYVNNEHVLLESVPDQEQTDLPPAWPGFGMSFQREALLPWSVEVWAAGSGSG